MSILNSASDGLPNVLIVLCKCLMIHRSLSREDLLGLCAPMSLFDEKQKPREYAQNTLNRWTDLGLFKEKNSYISFSDQLVLTTGSTLRSIESLPQILRSVVFAPHNNERLFESDDSKSADFTRALSWVLLQNVYTLAGDKHEPIAELEAKTGLKAFQNPTRWNGFKRWVQYLGFGWKVDDNVITFDPTKAIIESLSAVFGEREEMSQATFFERLASVLPILDGGAYRKAIEERLSPDKWKSLPSNIVSTSVSRALLRLTLDGTLELHDRSDAEKRSLIGRNGNELQRLSHITWCRG